MAKKLAITKGMANAMNRLASGRKCSECGFVVPRYVGKYPENCPQCNCKLMRESDIENIRAKLLIQEKLGFKYESDWRRDPEAVEYYNSMTNKQLANEIGDQLDDWSRSSNQWSVRDQLIKFTSWGFWSGPMMAAIDVEMADQIIRELREYLRETWHSKNQLIELYEAVMYGNFN